MTRRLQETASTGSLADPKGHSGEVITLDAPGARSCLVLEAAAGGVAAEWARQAGGTADGVELVEKLIALVRSVEANDAPPELDAYQAIGLPVFRKLLELLRAEVVRIWSGSDTPPPRKMVELLATFERTRTALEYHIGQSFTAQLAGPSGCEMAVEIAHNLRSPLTSVLFLSEALLGGHSGDMNPLQRRQLRLIYSATLGLTSTVSDVVELAHGGDALMEESPSPFSVSEMLESICDMVKPMAEQKKLDLRVRALTADRRTGYPTALSRVLLNLITNALKFTEEGYVEIVADAKGSNRVQFSVRDTGEGIDATRGELYQPFRRDSSGSRYGFSGSGLGLAICRKLTSAMESELQYETERGWGTRFFFEVNLPPANSH